MDQKVHQGGQLFGRILSPQTLTRWKEHGESRSELFANAAQVYNSRVKDPVNPQRLHTDAESFIDTRASCNNTLLSQVKRAHSLYNTANKWSAYNGIIVGYVHN